MRIAYLLTGLMVVGAACAPDLPNANSTISTAALDAPYPTLEPLPGLLARTEAGSTIEKEADALAARVARLKSRASAIRGRSVIDGQTRLKLLDAVRRRGFQD